jgi:hypothetical protein
VETALEARNRQEDYMKKTFVNQRSTDNGDWAMEILVS